MSDPFATIYITEFAKNTQVIEETLSPTWDELLLFDDILVYGTKEEIKKSPPTVVIEIYDQDKVGKSEFIGRTIAKPRVKLKENAYVTPTLEWFDITRGLDNAGELLATFEMIEYGSENIGTLPEPKPLMDFPRGKISFFYSPRFKQPKKKLNKKVRLCWKSKLPSKNRLPNPHCIVET